MCVPHSASENIKIRGAIDPVWFLLLIDPAWLWIVDRSRVVVTGGSHSGCIHTIYLQLRALWKTSSHLSEGTGRGENLGNSQHLSLKRVCPTVGVS